MAKNPNSAPSSDHNQGKSANSAPTGAFTAEQQKILDGLNQRIETQSQQIEKLTNTLQSMQDSYNKILAQKDAEIAAQKKRADEAEAKAAKATSATEKAKLEAAKQEAKSAESAAKRKAESTGAGAAAVEGAKVGFFANLGNTLVNTARSAFGHDANEPVAAEVEPVESSADDNADDGELPPLPGSNVSAGDNAAEQSSSADNETDKANQDDEANADKDDSGLDVIPGIIDSDDTAAGAPAPVPNPSVIQDPPYGAAPDSDSQPTTSLDPNSINNQGAVGVEPVISASAGNKGANDNESAKTKEKMSWRKKLLLGIAGVAVAAAAFFGINSCNAVNNNNSEPQATEATQTDNLNKETDDLENVIGTDTASLSSADLDAQMESFNKERDELSAAVQNNPDADQASIDEANNLLNSEQVQQYQAALQSLIDARDARQAEADKYGVSLEEYADYEQEADTLGISIDKVIEFSKNDFGVPADKLGTAEAQAYMRDNLTDPTNISEALNAETPEEAMEMLLFSMHNNRGTLAMMVNAMNEDGGVHDAGLDGLETPANIQKLYAEYKANPEKAEADFIRIRDALKNADIYQRDATSADKYSMFCSSNDELVCSYHAENDNGNKIIYHVTVYDEDGNLWFEFEFKQTCTQLVAGGNTYTPTTPEITTTTPGNPSAPGDPGTPPEDPPTPPEDPPTPPEDPPTPPDDDETPPPTITVKPKDPTDNDKQQNDAEGFEDDAPATDEDQTTGDDGMPEGDETGQIPGHQDTGDQDGDGAEDRPSEDNAVEGESAQTGNESGATDGLQSVTVGDDNLPGGGAGPAYDMGDGNIVYGDEALKEYLANQGVSE